MRAPYWPLEFRIRQPAWHRRLIGHRQRDSQRHPHLLRHPRVAERRAVLVAGLVVALAVIARGLLLAPAGGPTDEVPAWLDRQGRHAGLGEREMVRPIERAAHVGLVNHRQRFGAGCRIEYRAEGRPVDAQRVDVPRCPADVGYVEIDHRRRLLERHEGVLRVRLATEQPALLGRGRGCIRISTSAAPSIAATPEALSSAPLYIESALTTGPIPL